MIETDRGHKYKLTLLDAPGSPDIYQDVQFVKREGENFPGNVGHYPGVNTQEVHRMLIARYIYLRWQAEQMGDTDSVEDDTILINYNRWSLILLEERAARKHGRQLVLTQKEEETVESLPTCKHCGHIKPETHEKCNTETL